MSSFRVIEELWHSFVPGPLSIFKLALQFLLLTSSYHLLTIFGVVGAFGIFALTSSTAILGSDCPLQPQGLVPSGTSISMNAT